MKYCLGTVQFGMDYGIQGNGQPPRDRTAAMLTCALEHGIYAFDTASAYGEAEDVLGEFIRQNAVLGKKMHLVSKLRPDAFSGLSRSHWKEAAVSNAESSLERLGISRFSAYLFHSARYIFDEEAVSALTAVKDAGMTEEIGVSIYTPEEAMKALEYPQITVVQIPYNLFDQRLDQCDFLELAAKRDVTVYARSSLLQGLVVMDPDNLPSHLAFASTYLRQFRTVCAQYGVPLLQAAVGYVGAAKGIDYVVFGVDNLSQLKEYLSIRDTAIPEGMSETFRALFSEVEERLVNPSLWR